MGRPNGGKFSIYVDCVSPYSWFGITNTIRYRPLLQAHGVSVDIVPFFLGGAREAAGNPWTPAPKWKEAFSQQDTQMNASMLGITMKQPKEFPILTLFPVRVATFIKDNHGTEKFEAAFLALENAYWGGRGINISTPEGVIKALDGLFSTAELEKIMKGAVTSENKQRVLDLTKASGAFGAPWIVAVNAEGEKRSWFGNDRWDQVFEHLAVPYTPVSIIPPGPKANL